jgi:hypothetical protein
MQVFRSRSSAAPASPVTTDHILAEHAAEIRRLGKRALADVIEIGARLTKCKPICGHNNWLPWLDREFGWEATISASCASPNSRSPNPANCRICQ